MAVRLENLEKSSRWYPGAGVYCNVHVVSTEKIHVGVWGTYVTTPRVGEDFASVKIEANIENSAGEEIEVSTEIVAPDGSVVAKNKNRARLKSGDTFTQNFIVEKPLLWSPDTPHLYWARSQIYAGGKLVDKYSTRFGIRKIEYIAYKGFYLNGKPAAQKIVNTAGAPYRLELSTSSRGLSADGEDLAYVTVKVVDKDGNLCPLDNRLVKFKTAGAASYRAAANGDPTSLELFHLPQMRVFSGMLTVILQASRNPGECTLEASADGVKPGKIALQVK